MLKTRLVAIASAALLGVAAFAAPAQAALPPLPPASTSTYYWVKVTNPSTCSLYRNYTGHYYTDYRIWPAVYCQIRR